MKPGIDQILTGIVTVIANRMIPELKPGSYATGDAQMAAVLALLVAQETDRTGDTLARENREMRMMFLAASRMDVLPALRVRLAHDAALEEADLKLSTLSATHDRLSETLIALHATIETMDDHFAKTLDREIWDFLLRAAKSRTLLLPAI